MSAPTPAPGDDRPREGYYPDPSIPGYVRYWNGAAWVPGTSRPAPADGSAPAPPGGQAAPAAAVSVEETGPHFFDEDPDAHQGTEPASAWAADASHQGGFGGDQDRRVSWGSPQGGAGQGHAQGAAPGGPHGADPRVAGAGAGEGAGADMGAGAAGGHGPAQPDGHAARADGTATIPPAEAGDDDVSGTRVFRRTGAGSRPAAPGVPGPGGPIDDPGTMTFRALSPRTGQQGGATGAQPGSTPAVPGAQHAQAAGGFPGQGTGGTPGGAGVPGAGAPSPGVGGQHGGPGTGAAPGNPSSPGFGAGKAAAERAAAAQAGGGAVGGQAPGASTALSGPQQAPSASAPQQSPSGPQAAAQGAPQQTATPGVPHQPGGPGQPGAPAGAHQPGTPQPPATPMAPGPGGGQHSWAQQVHRLAEPGEGEQPAPWKPPVEDIFQAAARRQAAARPAGLGKRLAARLVDTLVVGAVTAVAAVPLGTKAADHLTDKIDAAKLSGETVTIWLLDGTTSVYLAIVLAVLLVTGVLYEALPTAKWGRTLGKKLLGLEVRDIEGHEPPSFGGALRRWLVYSVPGVLGIGVVGVLWCLFDKPWHQCWHDKAAHTFVAG